MTAIAKEKYLNTILYLCDASQNQTVEGKKKMYKLMYFIDFDRFERNESMTSVTGETYIHKPMGPVPSSMEQVVNEMVAGGLLEVKSETTWAGAVYPTVCYTALTKPDLSVFNEDDLFILNRVKKKYLRMSGTTLEHATHQEAPWNAVAPREEIPYELAFYRGTDFEDVN